MTGADGDSRGRRTRLGRGVLPAFALAFGFFVVRAFAGAPVSVSLDGAWSMAYSKDPAVPPASGWGDVQVPSFQYSDPERPHLWFRKGFALPAGFPARFNALSFGGVKYACAVYLNGTLLGEHADGFTPFELAVSPGLLRDQNDLLIRTSSWHSALDPDAGPPAVDDPDYVEDGLLYPIGSQVHFTGIWQGVSLEGFDGPRITGVFVRTSLREHKIDLEATVENPAAESADTALTAEVAEGGQTVLAFPSQVLSLGPGETLTVRAEQAWPTPHLWSPEDPHLYTMRTALSGGGGRTARFGFREFRVEGREFLLNGVPIKMRATACHPFAFSKEDALKYLREAKEGNNVAMRLHAQPWPAWWYDAADEVGMLLVWESGFFCMGRGYRVEDERFWANFRAHLEAQMTLHRNHPSVVIWSLENEILLTGGAERGQTPRARAAEAGLAALADFARSLDPGRPIMFEGDADPGEKADVLNLHYPHEYPGWNLWPQEGWWLQTTTRTDTWPGEIPPWPLSKPLYVGEFGWVPPSADVEASTLFLGDLAYRDLVGSYLEGKATAWAHQLEAFRALGVQGFCPWNIWEGSTEVINPLFYGVVKEKYAPNALFEREKGTRFFGGGKVSRTVDLFNDRPAASELTVTAELRVEGVSKARKRERFASGPAQVLTHVFQLKAPKVKEEKAGTLSFSVERAGQVVFSITREVRICPRSPLRAAGALDVFDPGGTMEALLRSEGVPFRRLASLGAIPADAKSIVVGPGGLGDLAAWQALRDFAAGGGRALLLPHEAFPPGVPFALQARGATIAFPRRASHPALAGVGEGDLQFWAPDHVVFREALVRPADGTFEVLADAGGREGLSLVGLMEVPAGGGSLLFCQLDLLPRLGVEPAARKLFQNLLVWLGATDSTQRAALTLEGVTEAEARALRRAGLAASEGRSSAPPAPGVIPGLSYEGLMDRNRVDQLHSEPEKTPAREVILAGSELDPSRIPALLEQVRAGDALWLHQPGESVLAALAAAGLGAEARPALRGIALLEGAAKAEGFTDSSLFWGGGVPTEISRFPPLSSSFAQATFGGAPDWGGAQALLPQDFTVHNGQAGDGFVYFWTNGALETELDLPQAGAYDLGLEGEGTPVSDEYPLLSVQLDGEGVGYVSVGGNRGVYPCRVDLAAGKHRLKLEFFNDDYAPPEDRNLTFFKLLVAQSPPADAWEPLTRPAALVRRACGGGLVVLDGLTWERPGAQARKQAFLVSLVRDLGAAVDPPAFSFTLEAEAMEVVDGALVGPQDGGMYFATAGTVAQDFALPQGGRCAVKVLATGTAVDGVYPLFDVAVDGVVLERLGVESDTPGYCVKEADLSAGGHRLAITFVNDAWDPPQDRNLFVDKAVISSR